MATLFYLPSASAAVPVITGTSATWTVVSSTNAWIRSDTVKTTTAMVTNIQTGTVGNKYKLKSFVTRTFSVSTPIAGSVSYAVSGRSTTFTNTVNLAIAVSVCNSLGVITSSLLSFSQGVFFYGTTRISDYQTATLTPQTANAGDFLLLEFGIIISNANDTGRLWFGDDGTADLSYTAQSTSTTQNPSIQFSDTFGANLNPWPVVTGAATNELMKSGSGN